MKWSFYHVVGAVCFKQHLVQSLWEVNYFNAVQICRKAESKLTVKEF